MHLGRLVFIAARGERREGRGMPVVHVTETTSLAPEVVLSAARDFSERRADLWPDVYVEHMTVHDRGDTWVDVTEGNPWPIGLVWERLRYDWSQPGSLRGTVLDSNLFKPGSSWEIRAATRGDDTLVEVIGVRHLRGRGWLLAPFFPTGLAKQTVAAHLHHFLSAVQAGDTS